MRLRVYLEIDACPTVEFPSVRLTRSWFLSNSSVSFSISSSVHLPVSPPLTLLSSFFLFLPVSVCVFISSVYFSFVCVGNCSQLFIDVQRWRQTFPHIKRPSATIIIIIISCWDSTFVFLLLSQWFSPVLFLGAYGKRHPLQPQWTISICGTYIENSTLIGKNMQCLQYLTNKWS